VIDVDTFRDVSGFVIIYIWSGEIRLLCVLLLFIAFKYNKGYDYYMLEELDFKKLNGKQDI